MIKSDYFERLFKIQQDLGCAMINSILFNVRAFDRPELEDRSGALHIAYHNYCRLTDPTWGRR
jgi:hypothetical protein